MYSCSKCGLAVIVYDEKGKILEKPIKACNCNAPIKVEISAITHGYGGLKM